MLVFLSPAPLADDRGNNAMLPDGRQVTLRDEFPASGCYEILTGQPLWTAPWDDTDVWIVSDDCRYLVRWNIFGDREHGTAARGLPWDKTQLSWALKFYDSGKEIARYDTAELVDFPSLMRYTTWDWHYAWFDDSDENFSFDNLRLLVITSTHDRYIFDIATGTIVAEEHLWRHLQSAAICLVCAALAVVFVKLIRRMRSSSDRVAVVATANLATSVEATDRRSIMSFSLSTLLTVVTALAIGIALVFRCPYVVTCFAAFVGAIYISYLFFAKVRRMGNGKSHSFRFGVLYPSAAFAWLSVYVVSVFPVLSVMNWLRAGEDVRTVVGGTLYYPLILVCQLL